MKKFWLICLVCFLLCGVAYAADMSVKNLTRRDGYFENTRTVVLFAPLDGDGAPYIASRMKKELSRIFRYPYYRVIDEFGMANCELFPQIAKSHEADIVVMPVIAEFSQFRHYGRFWDGDAAVTTVACFRIHFWETGMGEPTVLETRYFDRNPEGPDTDPDWIFDIMWKRLMKGFPYRRIPTDRARNLSGDSRNH